VFAVLVFAVCATGSQQRSVTGVRFSNTGEVTQVAIDVSGDFTYRSDRIPDPDRIIFDVPGATLRLSEQQRGVTTIPVGTRQVKQIRVAQMSADIARVVVDLAGPVDHTVTKLNNPSRMIAEVRGTPTPHPPVAAKPLPQPALTALPPREVRLAIGAGSVLDFEAPVTRLATSNPEVVDAVVVGPQEVMIQARAPGQATVAVWTENGGRRLYTVTSEPSLEPLRTLLRDTFPGQKLDVRAARDSLVLVGEVNDRTIAERALSMLAGAAKTVVSNVTVPPIPVEKQILLRVKFAEVNRTVSGNYGLNIISTGAGNTIGRITTGQFPSANPTDISSGPNGANSRFTLADVLNIFAFRPDLNLAAMIRDLQNRGLLQILAEPNLVATENKEATFLAGGEFPVPVLQGGAAAGAVTVQFREFGIRLAFVPHVMPSGAIRLHVRPEVSTIDQANGVQVNGFNVPALSTRRFETEIELQPGATFSIAGLIDDRTAENLSRMPGPANIPILGYLFRSKASTKTKTELIVMVTPEIAAPGALKNLQPTMTTPFLPPTGTERKP
jgi:pilus assembly protein CpaC